MEITKVADYEAMSQYGAKLIFEAVTKQLATGDVCNIGLATGNTMIRLYEILAGMFNTARTDLSRLSTFNLDEYVGRDGKEVPTSHPLSYRKYMNENLFDRIDPALGFSKDRTYYPPSVDSASYDDKIEAAGGLHLQLLGIGFNGHIAFNEPMSEDEISVADFAALKSRVINLKPLTLQTNARLTAGNDMSLMPLQAITMGMAPILKAKKILLLACFPEQEAPLKKLIANPATPSLPASYIKDCPNTEIVYTADVITL